MNNYMQQIKVRDKEIAELKKQLSIEGKVIAEGIVEKKVKSVNTIKGFTDIGYFLIDEYGIYEYELPDGNELEGKKVQLILKECDDDKERL